MFATERCTRRKYVSSFFFLLFEKNERIFSRNNCFEHRPNEDNVWQICSKTVWMLHVMQSNEILFKHCTKKKIFQDPSCLFLLFQIYTFLRFHWINRWGIDTRHKLRDKKRGTGTEIHTQLIRTLMIAQ